MSDYSEFQVFANDEFFAEASGPRADAWRDAQHYAALVAAEGDSPRIEEITRRVIEGSECPEPLKSGGEVSPRVAAAIIAARDALTKDDGAEAYHQLYTIADPDCERSYLDHSGGPWVKLEALAECHKPNSSEEA